MYKRQAINNGYKGDIVDKLIRKHKYKMKNKNKNKTKTDKDKNYYVTAEYASVMPNILSNEFKKLNINVSF